MIDGQLRGKMINYLIIFMFLWLTAIIFKLHFPGVKIMDKNKPALQGISEKIDFVNLAGVFDEAEVRKGEIPSANCHGSARGMAELAAIMANKGKRLASNDGSLSDLMSEDTWNKMHSSEKVAKDAAFPGGI